MSGPRQVRAPVLVSYAAFGGAALPWLAGTITQNGGMQVLLPFAMMLAIAQFAIWRPIASRLG